MKRIKDFYLEILSESQNENHLSSDVVNKVTKVDTSPKEDNMIRVCFNTTYGKDIDLIVRYDDLKGWIDKNGSGDKQDVLRFVKMFLDNSKETDEDPMREVVDDNGHIMPDRDTPPNTTGRHVGSSHWDLEKVYKSSIPKTIRFYSGDLGIGVITW